jgi:hypothetical protein
VEGRDKITILDDSSTDFSQVMLSTANFTLPSVWCDGFAELEILNLPDPERSQS